MGGVSRVVFYCARTRGARCGSGMREEPVFEEGGGRSGDAYVRPVERFMPARMVETAEVRRASRGRAGRTYSGRRRRHSELAFPTFPIDQTLAG